MATPTLSALASALTSAPHNLPSPSPAFLTPILRPAPLPSLVATAKIRLLSSDLTLGSILAPSAPILPANLSEPEVQSTVLREEIFVQVLDIVDIGRSKWDQIEALEAERKGETTKGREVIRVIPTPADGEAPSSASTQALGATQPNSAQSVSKGPFKLLLQDLKGNKVFGFELKKVEKIGMPPLMNIGCKIMLRRGTKVARGMVLLDPGTVTVFGGKIDSLDKAWREGREQRLRDEVQRERSGGGE